MQIDLSDGLRRGLVVAAVAAFISLGVAACNDTTSIDPQRDRIPPTVTLTPNNSSADTVIAFSTHAKDNLGLKTIHVQAIGAVGFIFDTVFTSAVTDIQIPFNLFASRAVPAGTPVTITATAVQTASAINSVPVVNQFCVGNTAFDNACGHTRRVEVGDTVHVEADDPSGISQLGYEVRSTPGGPIDDSLTFVSNGQLTFQPHTFSMKLPYTIFPTTAYIQVFARNSNGVRAYAKLASGVDRIDTVTVVAGVTRFLPFGGQVADAMYHPGKDRLYLTNIARNEVEVFNLADSSFKAPVIVGSRPWGLAGWPRDRTGAMGDTILVANSGGTNISYIDLNAGASGSGLEVFRYDLPNIIAFTITTTTSGTSGLPIPVATKYDFSDRPQYLGATCIAPAGACTDVVLTYSTTPTSGQSVPFSNRNGTLRWENLTTRTSHLFFEQAMGQSAARADTLEVICYAADGLN